MVYSSGVKNCQESDRRKGDVYLVIFSTYEARHGFKELLTRG